VGPHILNMSKSAVLIVVLGLALFASVISAAAPMGDASQTITDETFVPTTQAAGVMLNHSGISGASYDPFFVTVKTNSSGIQKLAQSGKDYNFYLNGSVAAIPSGSLDGLGAAQITYRYSQPNKVTAAFSDIWGHMAGSVGVGAILIVVIMLMVSALRGMG
jgi:hypothetical protein